MPSQGLYERFVNFYTDFAEISKYDTAERLAYQDSLKDYRDYYNTIYTAKEEGRTEGYDDGMQKGLQQGLVQGRAEGIEEGRAEAEAKAHEEKLEMARKMKVLDIPMNQIVAISGFPADEVEGL